MWMCFFTNNGKAIFISRFSSLLLMFVACLQMNAQTHLRIHHDGAYTDVPIEQIDSITFVNVDATDPENAELSGIWLWGDTKAGYYELLTFNDDNTYTAYDNYFTYGFDTMTYGWFFKYGTLLTLQSNGFGYQHKYTWFLMDLSSNTLNVMTKMGQFTYYKLGAEVITLHMDDVLECDNGDSFVFADGVIVDIADGKLIGKAKGVSYIQKYLSSSNKIFSYKVVVE